LANEQVVIYAMGDRQIQQGKPREVFEKEFAPIIEVIRDGDIRYCQLECMFSDRPMPIAGAPLNLCLSPKFLSLLKYVGIDITSPNGNHNMEYGTAAMVDCLEALKKNGIEAVGAGRNIQEARKPAVFDVKGAKIAFLAYNSAIRPGEEAGPDRPGVAPLRVDTFYQMVELNQPGTPPRIRTFANQEDLKALKDDIARAKQIADVVIVCYHAGIHFIRARMADYQFEVCHAAIDAGADLILGTHPHVLKAIEVYRGRVIFHSLANFGFDKPRDPGTGEPRTITASPHFREQLERYGIRIENREKAQDVFGAWSDEALQTGIARIVIRDKKISRVSFLPVLFDRDERPARVLKAGEADFNRLVTYIRDTTREAGVNTQFAVEGNEVVVLK
jgi:hypothetical protein